MSTSSLSKMAARKLAKVTSKQNKPQSPESPIQWCLNTIKVINSNFVIYFWNKIFLNLVMKSDWLSLDKNIRIADYELLRAVSLLHFHECYKGEEFQWHLLPSLLHDGCVLSSSFQYCHWVIMVLASNIISFEILCFFGWELHLTILYFNFKLFNNKTEI